MSILAFERMNLSQKSPSIIHNVVSSWGGALIGEQETRRPPSNAFTPTRACVCPDSSGLSSHCICMDTFARQCLEIPTIWIRSVCLLTPAARNSSAGLTAWKLEEFINFQPPRLFIWLMTMHLVLLLDVTFQGNLPWLPRPYQVPCHVLSKNLPFSQSTYPN